MRSRAAPGTTLSSAFPPERGQHNFDGFTVFKDPSAPAAERYKLVFMAHVPPDEFERRWAEYQALHPRYQDVRLRPGKFTCVYGAVSPDGLDWTLLPEPLFTHFTDTITTAYYDAWLGRYVLYTRMYLQGRRWVGRTETADFRRWPPVEPLLWPRLDESPSNDIYTNARTSYPGEPSYPPDVPDVLRALESDFAHSASTPAPTGSCGTRCRAGAVIKSGDAAVSGTRSISVPAPAWSPLGDERVGLLYSGTSYPHKYPRWPHVVAACPDRLGLVASRPPRRGRCRRGRARFWTFPVQPRGRELRVSFQARGGGGVWVGVHGQPGRGGDGLRPALTGTRSRRRCAGTASRTSAPPRAPR